MSENLDWIVGRIRDGYDPKKIILFGSLARGDAHEREDVEALAHVVACHAHQPAEKYLKEPLALHRRVEPPKIHNLRLLLIQVGEQAPDLNSPKLQDATNGLDQFYIPSRYPAEVGGPEGPISAEDAAEAFSCAESIATVVRPRLSAEDG